MAKIFIKNSQVSTGPTTGPSTLILLIPEWECYYAGIILSRERSTILLWNPRYHARRGCASRTALFINDLSKLSRQAQHDNSALTRRKVLAQVKNS